MFQFGEHGLELEGEEQTLFTNYCVRLFEPAWQTPEGLLQGVHISVT